jgi:hypothetical protein
MQAGLDVVSENRLAVLGLTRRRLSPNLAMALSGMFCRPIDHGRISFRA